MRYLLLLCAALLAAGCNRGPDGARKTARAFLEASYRGDASAVRKLVTAPDGTPEDVIAVAIDTRIATASATRRVAEAATKRFGPATVEASPLFRGLEDELRAVDAATVEQSGDTVHIPIPRRKALTLRRGFWSWKVVLFDAVPTAAYRERVAAGASAAASAAEFTVLELEAGACADAQCAAEMFQSRLFVERSRATAPTHSVERGPAIPGGETAAPPASSPEPTSTPSEANH